ncbi:hypothetical protein CYMTET_23140, partial [Cymbomonas tetramitiformis]
EAPAPQTNKRSCHAGRRLPDNKPSAEDHLQDECPPAAPTGFPRHSLRGGSMTRVHCFRISAISGHLQKAPTERSSLVGCRVGGPSADGEGSATGMEEQGDEEPVLGTHSGMEDSAAQRRIRMAHQLRLEHEHPDAQAGGALWASRIHILPNEALSPPLKLAGNNPPPPRTNSPAPGRPRQSKSAGSRPQSPSLAATSGSASRTSQLHATLSIPTTSAVASTRGERSSRGATPRAASPAPGGGPRRTPGPATPAGTGDRPDTQSNGRRVPSGGQVPGSVLRFAPTHYDALFSHGGREDDWAHFDWEAEDAGSSRPMDNFLKRQEQHVKVVEGRIEALRQELTPAPAAINPKSRAIADAKFNNTFMDRLQKDITERSKQKQKVDSVIAQVSRRGGEGLEECTFKPAINATSRARKQRSLDDLSRGDLERRAQTKAAATQVVRNREMDGVTFKPAKIAREVPGTRSKLQLDSDLGSYLDRVHEEHAKQRHVTEQHHQSQQETELAKCTFRPEVRPAPKYVQRLSSRPGRRSTNEESSKQKGSTRPGWL